MIDLKQELQKYPSIDLKNLIENQPDLPDNYKNSAILYNKALESIRSGSEDIAIIELKKAVAINPDFHEAINLLGLCYGDTKDYAKAEEMFQRVIEAESNSVRAMEYMNLFRGKSISEVSGANKDSKNKAHPAGKKVEGKLQMLNKPGKIPKSSVAWKTDLLKYAAGVFIGIVVMVLINFLTAGRNPEDLPTVNNSESTQAQSTADAEDSMYKTKFNELDEKYKSLKSNLDKAYQSINYYSNVIKLLDAEKLASSGDYAKAAELIVLLRPASFQGVEKEKFDKLSNEIMPKASKDAYNQGVKLFKEEKFQEALDRLSKAQIYGAGQPYMDGILYNIAKCYMELGDYPNAISAFTSIINDYPNSGYVKYSKNWIKSIEDKQ